MNDDKSLSKANVDLSSTITPILINSVELAIEAGDHTKRRQLIEPQPSMLLSQPVPIDKNRDLEQGLPYEPIIDDIKEAPKNDSEPPILKNQNSSTKPIKKNKTCWKVLWTHYKLCGMKTVLQIQKFLFLSIFVGMCFENLIRALVFGGLNDYSAPYGTGGTVL